MVYPALTTADAHTSAASSRLNGRTRRFKCTRPFRRKTKSGFCAFAITFQKQSNAGYTMFRSSVKGTDYPLHSPVSPSLPLPMCHRVPSRFICTLLRFGGGWTTPEPLGEKGESTWTWRTAVDTNFGVDFYVSLIFICVKYRHPYVTPLAVTHRRLNVTVRPMTVINMAYRASRDEKIHSLHW